MFFFCFSFLLLSQFLTSSAQVDTSSGAYLPVETDGSCGSRATDLGQFGEFPFLAAVGYDVGGKIHYESDGFLINRRYILTHSAFHSKEHPVIEVVLGQNEFDSGSCPSCKPAQKFKISPQDVIVHPNYKIEEMLKSGNEVLLVRLPAAAVTFLEDKQVPVLPICLPWNTTTKGDISTKGDLLVSAWERRESDTGFFSNIKSDKVSFMKGESCKQITAYNLISTDRHVCAGGADGSDACIGRNGVPLFESSGSLMYLKGMASFGPVPCHDETTKGIPGVYASIDFYVPWIRSQLKP